jgi:hypothetical protein
MSKKNNDLQKVTINLRSGDWDYISSILGSSGVPTSIFIRNLISRRVDELRKKEQENTAIQMELSRDE